MKTKFKISWNMLFMAMGAELLIIISYVLINSTIESLSQTGYYFAIPSTLFFIITVMYWNEVYNIGEAKLQEQLNSVGIRQ